MSGIVGLLNLDGAPIDRSLLERMTEFMTFRGPDDQQVWIEDAVGFGHTMLRTTWEAEYEQQPFTLDREVWIVADARIDDRAVLAEKLGIAPLPSFPFGKETKVITDVELILRAYLEWGDGCVDHLLGDFAFAIWDGRKQRLFCARDQFGVKPFYYSRVGNCLIISNTLNCIRQHPQVSSKLNEAAIGDFLLFGQNYNLETTTFLDIQRLPPAHTLSYAGDSLTTKRYWKLPLPELIRYKKSQDYIDHFQELMGKAVGDRLRQEKVGTYFSGGLDSTTIAATAVEFASQHSHPLDLQAFTTIYNSLIVDNERYYADIAAKSLGIPIHYQIGDDYELFDGWDCPGFSLPEPGIGPLENMAIEQGQKVASHSRVALIGYGGDEGLKGSSVFELFLNQSPLEVIRDVSYCLIKYRIEPHWGSGLLAKLRNARSPKSTSPVYPSWLNSEFETRLDLPARWQKVWSAKPNPQISPRANAHYILNHPLWASVLECADPNVTQICLERRYPFLDLRLLNYLLALPYMPWCVNKALLRIAMKNSLPAEILNRPKTPLNQDPVILKLSQTERVQDSFMYYNHSLNCYLDSGAISRLDSSFACSEILTGWERIRAESLGHWLDRLPQGVYFEQLPHQ
jgi:asparagine synthase (glutamine-hydrolysing)